MHIFTGNFLRASKNFGQLFRGALKMATEEEGSDKDSDWSLTGFLFGNINEKGELEDGSILDEVTG